MDTTQLSDEISKENKQKSIAVIYHSSYGHTRRVAQAIAEGVTQVSGVKVQMLDIEKLTEENWIFIDNANMLVFGSAVYMGSVTARFKVFMDSTSKRWYERRWQGKWAAGFANSGGLSGDKLAVLQQINLFAMQHGMLWAGLPLLPTGSQETDLNRLSGFLGLMTQSNNAPPDKTPPKGDINTAIWFGNYLAQLVTNK